MQVDTRRKHCIPAVAEVDGFRDNSLGGRSAFNVLVVKIIDKQAFGTIGRKNVIEAALIHFVSGKSAGRVVVHFAHFFPDALQNSSICSR